MKDILLPRHRPALERFARLPALLAFDYDGVLVPLVKDPTGTRMRERTRRLLRALAGAYPCAVVSGRAWRDVASYVDGLVPMVVGNHGYELGEEVPVPPEILERVKGWEAELAAALAGVPGLYFEEKRCTLAVHYGRSRRWRSAGKAVRAAAERLHGARLVQGKKVVNILPGHFPTKGDAVRALLARGGLETALYCGDDVTDEDVFEIGQPAVLGIHVGEGRSLAPFRLRSQRDTDRLLEVLLQLRSR
jgi:trehalose 6-phosphate phosphatase